MQSTYWAAGALAVALFAGCGGDDRPKNADEGGGARPNTGGTGSGGKGNNPGGENAGGSDGDDDGPLVSILSPEGASSPDDGVLSGQTVNVVCLAKAATSGAAVDGTSIVISLTDSAGSVVEKTASATAEDDEYEADLVIATAAPGEVTIACSAKDRDGADNKDTITAFLDRGPSITIISPLPESAHPLKGGLDVTFTVDAVPLTDSDPGADVSKVTFSLDGKECVVGDAKCQVEEVSAGRYHTVLAIDDTNEFPVAPSGAITITAENSRDPEPVVATSSYNITVDGTGPVIKIESPAPQSVVGGKVQLVFTVTDTGSGVDMDSVNVTLYPATDAPKLFYDPEKGWSRNGDRYTLVFDTKDVEKFAPVQTTVNVRASDQVANTSANGQSIQLYLDNVAPSIDLDPRNVRVRSGANCSNSFDPVGPRSLNDLDGQFGSPIVNPIAYFRVFVDEETNRQAGQTIFYNAGTDQTQVRLYIQSDPANQATKLLVNKNPAVDNTCDDIGGIDNVVDAPPFSELKPISANSSVGTPWNEVDGEVEPTVGAGVCTLTAGSPPERLCPAKNSDMWYAAYDNQLKEPYVYVVGTPNPSDVSCAGIDLAFLPTNQPDGWVCAAARVVDNAGNVGISPPLRVCVDDGKGEPPACRVSSTTPPTCTDGCVPPVRGGGKILIGQ